MPRTYIFIFIFTIIAILGAVTAPFALELADFEVKAGPESARVVQTLSFECRWKDRDRISGCFNAS